MLLTSILLLGACATTPTMKSVAEEYELKIGEDTVGLILLENGIVEISKLRGITKLDIGVTKISNIGINALKQSLPNCEIY